MTAGQKETAEDLVSIPSSLFSDDSSFYGGDQIKAIYEQKVVDFNPKEFLEIQKWNLRCIAAQEGDTTNAPAQGVKRKREESPKSTDSDGKGQKSQAPTKSTHDGNSKLGTNAKTKIRQSTSTSFYNPYEGQKNVAKQDDESLDDFLTRLAPSTTSSLTGPWIWIAYPYAVDSYTAPDLEYFKMEGNALLDEYMNRKSKLESENPDKPPASITRMLKTDREWLEDSIFELATSTGVTCGKWMLFLSINQVDKVWATVAKATLEGKLGSAAKVATNDKSNSKPERVVIIYTYDFSDLNDVKRVLRELKSLKLVKDEVDAKPIYYKLDAYTYLDLGSGNEYKLKVSMYNSRDLCMDMRSED